MIREEIFVTDPMGRSALGFVWTDEEVAPTAVVQIAHGMTEHLKRYERFAAALTKAGFAVVAGHHPGHGHGEKPEDLGFFGENGFWGTVDRMHAFTLYAKNRFPNMPVVLLGHSMGSFMTRSYCTKYGTELDGAIFMGTAGPNPAAKAGLVLVKLHALVKGWRGKSSFVQNLMFGSYNKPFPEESSRRWLTKDMEIVKDYDNDPYCGFRFTLNGYKTLPDALTFVSRKDWASKLPTDLPILVVSGADDPVGDFGKGVKIVAQRIKDAGVKDVTLQLYPNDRHEVLNETDYEQVTADLIQWLNKVCHKS